MMRGWLVKDFKGWPVLWTTMYSIAHDAVQEVEGRTMVTCGAEFGPEGPA